MPSEKLDLFDLMNYYPEQAAEKKRKEEASKPIKTHKNDRLDYPTATAEIERILGKKVTTVCGYYDHPINKEIRWLFNLEIGCCYINEKCQLYATEEQKGYKYRGKVHEEVFYSADERKRATTTIK